MTTDQRSGLRRDLANLTAGNNHHAERFLAELDFAEGLVRLHPRKTAAWTKLIARAEDAVSHAVAAGQLDRLGRAVQAAEEILAPIGKVAKTYTIHCVGHGHIDMNWMWSWPETVAVTNDTFITVLKLMEEFGDFCYTQSQASVYAILRHYSPELQEQVRRRVAEGRWEVAAVHWVEGDKNLAAGEALARHLLYTRRFMQETFGLAPEDVPLDWEPDTFGHAATIPTIISRGAVRRYYLCRGGNWEKPPVFWWQGPDGSRVLVNRSTTWYNGTIGPPVAISGLEFWAATGIRDWMCCYGVGDHGGGPTRRDILRAHDMDSWPVYPRFRLTTTGAYYRILEQHGQSWPVIQGELNFEFTGCYTTQTQIKRNNRYGENYMLEAEVAATLAHRALGRSYPAEKLRESWIEVLFSQFHDILPGSGGPETRQYNQGTFQRIAAASSMIKTHCLRALAGAVDTSFARCELPPLPPERESIAIGGGAGRGTMLGGLSTAGHVVDGPRPVVVFNPLPFARGEVVQGTVWDADTGAAPGDLAAKSFLVRGSDGQAVPAQKLGSGNYWGHKYVDLIFPAKIGPLGYAAYAIAEDGVEGHVPSVKCLDEPPRHVSFGPALPALENEFLAVAFDPATGGVVKLLDKSWGVDLADPADPMGTLEYVRERPFGMSAWVIADLVERCGPLRPEALSNPQRGPHAASIQARFKVKDSTVAVTYTLKAAQRWLEILIEATWLERGGPQIGTPGLKMCFPLALRGARGRYEIPFGWIERQHHRGEEVSALRWADVVGKVGRSAAAAGCALLNDCKHGHSLDGATLRVTLIRSSYEPDPLPEIGQHSVRLAVVPHGKALAPAELIRLAAAFNHPLQVIPTDAHEGKLPPAGAAITSVGPANVVLSSLKKAEDDEAIVLRLYETEGRSATARVALNETIWQRPVRAVEVDLLERPVKNSSAKATRGGFTVRVPARGIASVKVSFAARAGRSRR